MNKIVFQVFAILLFPLVVFSQDVSTSELKWSTSKTIDQNTNKEVDQLDYFVSHAGATIDWTQINVNRTYTFTITATEGGWNNVNNDGQLNFKIKRGSITGSILFKREASLLTIEMIWIKEGQVIKSLKFNTDSVIQVQP